MDPKYLRRQKEIARQQEAQKKRAEKAARRQRKEPIDDGLGAIQAALDAGLNPGRPEDRLEQGDAADAPAEPSEDSSDRR